jgi:hypothetical protein
MTPQEIRDAIAASPELQALQAAGNVQAIADALSVGRTKVSSHFASERGILERYPLGPIEADALLAALEAFAATQHPMARIVGRALKFLAQPEGLDIGSPATLGLLDQLMVGGVLTQTQRDGLRQMATVPDPIVREQVTEAIYG